MAAVQTILDDATNGSTDPIFVRLGATSAKDSFAKGELQREIRVFCHEGRATAASQDILWEKAGWRERYTDGFVKAITDVWANVKDHLLFDTCTMDVLVNPSSEDGTQPWPQR